jgi:hypothetical protein
LAFSSTTLFIYEMPRHILVARSFDKREPQVVLPVSHSLVSHYVLAVWWRLPPGSCRMVVILLESVQAREENDCDDPRTDSYHLSATHDPFNPPLTSYDDIKFTWDYQDQEPLPRADSLDISQGDDLA